MAASQLASNGYRIAKSWQYQENLPAQVEEDQGPLNNNTLRPILMANYPPVQPQRNRSAFAGLKRERIKTYSNAAASSEAQKQLLPKSPMSGQTPNWYIPNFYLERMIDYYRNN